MSEQAKVAPRKVEIVQNLIDDFSHYTTIGIIQMSSIGAKTVQKLRADLRGRAKIKVAKNTLMKKALELDEELEGKENLRPYITGPVAFLFTNESPYSIANYLENNKVSAPAKAGQVAPKSVTVPKQNTGVPPGTFISELNSVGLPTRIEEGTIAIPEDTVVVEPGEKISVTLASILSRLGIEPFEVGLSLQLVLEGGDIIDGSDLLIDFGKYKTDLISAYQQAINLSVNAGILTSTTAPMAIGSAQRKALALAAATGYITPKSASTVIGRARGLAIALMQAALQVDSSAVPEEVASLATVASTSAPTSTSAAEEAEDEEEEFEEEEEGEEVDEDLGGLF